MIVVDASVIVSALGDDGPDGQRCRQRLRGESLAAPELIDLEVMSAWRRIFREDERGKQAVGDLRRLRVARAPHASLVERCWELRHNLTPYDAVYVALAERLGVALLTADRRIDEVPGLRCEVELIA